MLSWTKISAFEERYWVFEKVVHSKESQHEVQVACAPLASGLGPNLLLKSPEGCIDRVAVGHLDKSVLMLLIPFCQVVSLVFLVLHRYV